MCYKHVTHFGQVTICSCIVLHTHVSVSYRTNCIGRNAKFTTRHYHVVSDLYDYLLNYLNISQRKLKLYHTKTHKLYKKFIVNLYQIGFKPYLLLCEIYKIYEKLSNSPSSPKFCYKIYIPGLSHTFWPTAAKIPFRDIPLPIK